MLSILLTVLHVIVALILILVVLLQTGKRADLAGAFGGGGSQTVFGTRGAATFLSKLTTTAAIVFMLTSLGLSLVSASRSRDRGASLPEGEPQSSSAPAPAPSDSGSENVPVVPQEEVEGSEQTDADTGAAPAESQPE